MDTIIREDQFSLYKKSFQTFSVKLDYNCLSYTPVTSNSKVNITITHFINEIVGCALLKSNKVEFKDKVYITVYFYPLINRKKRKRKTVTFEVSSQKNFEENFQIAHTWKKSLYQCMYHSKDNGMSFPLFKFLKKVLILINPKSGPGVALRIFELNVKPILLEAELAYDMVITDHANHAYELVQHKDLRLYAGIVIIAGDGLIYEVYNGLFQRSDRDSALSIPIGVIPGGSGNGLASSLSHSLNEPYLSNPALVSTLNIVNPVVTPLDLVLLQTHKRHNLLSFLSIGYGVISDIDIESERLRKLGEARFVLYGLAKIFSRPVYRVRLSYKVASEHEKMSSKIDDPLCLTHSQSIPKEISEDQYDPNTKIMLGSRPHSLTLENSSKSIIEQVHLSPFDMQQVKEREGKPSQDITSWDSHIDLEGAINLDDPVPSDWKVIEDDFISIYAVNTPYIGSEACISPKSSLDDGVMWLCFIKANVSRSVLTKFMVSLDSGTHINLPDVTYVPVTDLRIVPLTSSGKLTIDGELIELGPIQASVLPRKGRLMVRRP